MTLDGAPTVAAMEIPWPRSIRRRPSSLSLSSMSGRLRRSMTDEQLDLLMRYGATAPIRLAAGIVRAERIADARQLEAAYLSEYERDLIWAPPC